MIVDVIGDSHVARLKREWFALEADMCFWAKRGGGLRHLQDTVDAIEWAEDRVDIADVTVVFLGGNEMDSVVDLKEKALAFAAEINRLSSVSRVVMIMRAWQRPGARIGAINYWTNVSYFEHLLSGMLFPSCWLWRWDRSLTFTHRFFARDGVHCRDGKLKAVVRYMTSAVLAGIRRLRRQ